MEPTRQCSVMEQYHGIFFKSTWQRINGHIDIKGIIADSGFYLRQFIELLEQRELTYIIAARLYHPLQRMVYARQNWQEIAEGIWITEFFFQHEDWITDRRFIAVRQDIKRRPEPVNDFETVTLTI